MTLRCRPRAGGDPYAAARQCGTAATTETPVVMGPRLRGDDSGWFRANMLEKAGFPLSRGRTDEFGGIRGRTDMAPMRLFLASLAAVLAIMSAAQAQTLEKKQITLAVGGKTALYYLPLTIAERLGHFKEQGLDVAINDFRGGAQSLQALAGGSVDVVTGAYEHTIRMQAKGQDVRAVVELGRFPGIVLGIRKD